MIINKNTVIKNHVKRHKHTNLLTINLEKAKHMITTATL